MSNETRPPKGLRVVCDPLADVLHVVRDEGNVLCVLPPRVMRELEREAK